MWGPTKKKFPHADEVRIGKILGEYVGALSLGVYVHQLYGSVSGQVPHVMLFDFHVFVPACDHAVGCHVYTGLVVFEDCCWTGLWYVELLQRVS